MSTPQFLRVYRLPRLPPISYNRAGAIQEKLVANFLAHKALVSSRNPPSPLPASPVPTLLLFSPPPVYTTGRRERGTLTQDQVQLLTQPLPSDPEVAPTITESLRGGQITFHGPGQLVIYPILDLKAVRSPKWPNGLTARCYVNVLEEATIQTLARWKIKSFRTENPGVWVSQEKKIAALGIHLRRNITSFGIGLNLHTDLAWFKRIVACGLEGKQMTSMAQERSYKPDFHTRHTIIAKHWIEEFVTCIWGDEHKEEKQARIRWATAEERRDLLQEAYSDKLVTAASEEVPDTA